MPASHSWQRLRLIIALVAVVLCLFASMVYIGPTSGGRSSHSRRIRFESFKARDPSSSHLDDVNGPPHLMISPPFNGTLGVFSQIFVISLAMRLDRRTAMERLRHALALNWTYVDAVSPQDTIITEVSEHVRLLRERNNVSLFEWPHDLHLTTVTTSTISLSFMDKSYPWVYSIHCVDSTSARNSTITSASAFNFCPTSQETSIMISKPRIELPQFPNATSSSIPLTCAVANNINGVEFSPSLPSHMRLTPSKLACWYSHMSAIVQFASRAHPSRGAALFLEDDVDMEHDIRENVELVWSFLPSDWDVVFLGHCWSNESHYPALIKIQRLESSPILSGIRVHPSFAPKCTHAYALSYNGAHRLLQHLLYPPFLYSRAFDQALSWLVESNRLKAFSLVPSIVVQRKVDKSDIDGGEGGLGSTWKDCLNYGILDF